MVTVVLFSVVSFPTFLSLPSLTMSNSFLPVAVVLHTPLILTSSSLLTQSSHRNLVFLASCSSTFWTSVLFANYSTPILSTCPAHFNLIRTSFFLKRSFTPTSTLSSFILLLSALSTATILLIHLVSQT